MPASPWYRSFQKALRWSSYIAAHALVTILLILVIEGIQWVVTRLGEPKLFDTVPLRYIFDAMDLGILLVFLIVGTLEAVRVFRENDDG